MCTGSIEGLKLGFYSYGYMYSRIGLFALIYVSCLKRCCRWRGVQPESRGDSCEGTVELFTIFVTGVTWIIAFVTVCLSFESVVNGIYVLCIICVYKV